MTLKKGNFSNRKQKAVKPRVTNLLYYRPQLRKRSKRRYTLIQNNLDTYNSSYIDYFNYN